VANALTFEEPIFEERSLKKFEGRINEFKMKALRQQLLKCSPNGRTSCYVIKQQNFQQAKTTK